ncbi:MAG: HAMP domain-containing histidine kinase [Anaerolineae bacterium]|nr:HAMP domain-containing histidine kinase [Anaerolineae bacterium]MCA9892127.1 HAMP domain-containing histidine kinase [Anaerolineae bacterium]
MKKTTRSRTFIRSFFRKPRFDSLTIRARLLLAYGSILLIGFTVITVMAGNQLSTAARSDYERSLRNEAHLIARGMDILVADQPVDSLAAAPDFDEWLAAQTSLGNGTTALAEVGMATFSPSANLSATEEGNGVIALLTPDGDTITVSTDAIAAAGGLSMWRELLNDNLGDNLDNYTLMQGTRFSFINLDADFESLADAVQRMPELNGALSGNSVVVERRDDTGQMAFFVAAPIRVGRFPPQDFQLSQDGDGNFEVSGNINDLILPTFVQVSVPSARLQTIIMERWVELLVVFGLLAVAALIATLWVSRSITRPLYALRESAIQLSQGDFSHRVKHVRQDEIGEVATAFNEMAHQVESMIDEQRAFASNTSHELRTPLTTIRLRSEALRYDRLDMDTSKQYITEIDDEVRRLGSLVEDLTLLSRFDAGRGQPGQDEIDMRRFASSLLRQVQPQAEARQITLALESADEANPVHASLNHLTVVFRNILDNAIKYTPEGGSIHWEIVQLGEGVRCIITDTGQGIEAEQLGYVFERFYRADKSHSREVPGTGLGLALCRSIVTAYGGDIQVTSEGLNQGTRVTVFWPFRTP